MKSASAVEREEARAGESDGGGGRRGDAGGRDSCPAPPLAAFSGSSKAPLTRTHESLAVWVVPPLPQRSRSHTRLKSYIYYSDLSTHVKLGCKNKRLGYEADNDDVDYEPREKFSCTRLPGREGSLSDSGALKKKKNGIYRGVESNPR